MTTDNTQFGLPAKWKVNPMRIARTIIGFGLVVFTILSPPADLLRTIVNYGVGILLIDPKLFKEFREWKGAA